MVDEQEPSKADVELSPISDIEEDKSQFTEQVIEQQSVVPLPDMVDSKTTDLMIDDQTGIGIVPTNDITGETKTDGEANAGGETKTNETGDETDTVIEQTGSYVRDETKTAGETDMTGETETHIRRTGLRARRGATKTTGESKTGETNMAASETKTDNEEPTGPMDWEAVYSTKVADVPENTKDIDFYREARCMNQKLSIWSQVKLLARGGPHQKYTVSFIMIRENNLVFVVFDHSVKKFIEVTIDDIDRDSIGKFTLKQQKRGIITSKISRQLV